MTRPAGAGEPGWPDVVAWPDLRAYLLREWKAGQHAAVFAPTGTGKTYLWTRGLAPLWSHTLSIDPKPGDPDNMRHARALGARIVPGYPEPNLQRLWGKEPYPDRHYWVLPSLAALRQVLDDVMTKAWLSARNGKGWVVYVDEIKLLCARHPDGADLAHHVIRILRYGRGRGITLVGATQSPRYNGPGMADLLDQPRWTYVGYTSDANTIERYAETSGFPRQIGMRLVPELGEHEWWLMGPGRLSVRFELPGPRPRRPAHPTAIRTSRPVR